MAGNPKSDLQELIRDVKEHVSYLNELGVSGLDVDMPQAVIESRASAAAPAATPALEKPYIPSESEIKSSSAQPAVSQPRTESNQARRSLLESTRLSSMASISEETPKSNKPTEETEKEAITLKKTAAADTMKESLFGDITQALPESNETFEDIRADIGDCRRCGLCEGRKNIAHTQGNLKAELMFIGEAPGADEDEQGKPFVGRAGQLLTKIIEAIDMKREDVLIGNINRCRPPQNRAPLPEEVALCKPFLLREIAVARPKVIVVLGNTACQNLLDTKVGISKLRGNFQDYYGVKVMPTFHPAYLLRDPHKKREVWEDMKKVRDYLTENR